ncbi:ABC-three component system middle component 7 [Pseudomonas sp. NBRC 111144]|uniref:ABC-three component system middle component 7 n=1 Tax=Pseudomonas sp. NBRC 111144 TaxID=1661059 RepID=UPI00352612BB
MLAILANKIPGETVTQALTRTKDDFLDASEFLAAMHILYFLGYLDVQDGSGVIEYA